MGSAALFWLTGTCFHIYRLCSIKMLMNGQRSSPADSFPFAQQEQEAMFDLKLVAALESNVVPHLGDIRIPDSLVTHFARILAQGSKLRSDDDEDEVAILHPAASSSKATVSDARTSEEGESEERSKGRAVAARERFAYWCFDLLFLICSDVQKGTPNPCSSMHNTLTQGTPR